MFVSLKKFLVQTTNATVFIDIAEAPALQDGTSYAFFLCGNKMAEINVICLAPYLRHLQS